MITIIHVANSTVTVPVSEEKCFDSHVSTEENLRYVVKKLDRVGIDCRNAQFHDEGTDKDESDVGKSNAHSCGEFSEWPSLVRK